MSRSVAALPTEVVVKIIGYLDLSTARKVCLLLHYDQQFAYHYHQLEIKIRQPTPENDLILYEVIRHNDVQLVQVLLGNVNFDVNFKGDDGNTLLHLAVNNNLTQVAQLLLSKEGIDANAQNHFGWTPLHLAVRRNFIQVVKLLLCKDGINVNIQDHNGFSPLHMAAQHGTFTVVQLLLAKDGIDVRAKEKRGLTPLHIATQYGTWKVVMLLLDKDGIDALPKENKGLVPILLTHEYGHVKSLIDEDQIDDNVNYNTQILLKLRAWAPTVKSVAIIGCLLALAFYGAFTWTSTVQGGILTVFALIGIPELVAFTLAYGSNYINVIMHPEKGETSVYLAIFMLFLTSAIRMFYAVFFFMSPIFHLQESPLIKTFQTIVLYMVSSWWLLTICLTQTITMISYLFHERAGNHRLDSATASESLPKFIFILPVYNEDLELLKTGIQSILGQDYPNHLVEIHCAFDDGRVSELYAGIVENFAENAQQIEHDGTCVKMVIDNSVIYFHRWPHGGKRSAQAHTWNYLVNMSANSREGDIVILTDSDNIVLDQALNNLAVYFARYKNKIAFSGYMTCISKPSKWYLPNIMRIIQDVEYISYEANRIFEVLLGSVNCLPGGFTAIRFSALAQVADSYFMAEFDVASITQYHQFVLGEDRYLTHLVHKQFPPYTIGFCPVARCKTDPPDTVLKFIKQRRRWLLGALANEAYMLSTGKLWRKFPLLLIFKVIQNSWRSTIICQFLVATSAIISLMQEKEGRISLRTYLISAFVPLGIAWLSSIVCGIMLGRFKTIVLWPISILIHTILQGFIDIYALQTWNLRTWGGPRVSSQSAPYGKSKLVREMVYSA